MKHAVCIDNRAKYINPPNSSEMNWRIWCQWNYMMWICWGKNVHVPLLLRRLVMISDYSWYYNLFHHLLNLTFFFVSSGFYPSHPRHVCYFITYFFFCTFFLFAKCFLCYPALHLFRGSWFSGGSLNENSLLEGHSKDPVGTVNFFDVESMSKLSPGEWHNGTQYRLNVAQFIIIIHHILSHHVKNTS